MREKKAFSLIEVIIVVIIIGILAGIAIPKYQKSVERARIAEAVNILGALRQAQYRYLSKYSAYATLLSTLSDISLNPPKYFSCAPSSFNPTATDVANPYDASDDIIAFCLRTDSPKTPFALGPYIIYATEQGNFSAIDDTMPPVSRPDVQALLP